MKRDIVFLSCIGLIFAVLIAGTFLGPQKKESIIENRALEKLPNFSINTLLDNSYQQNLEIALTDQILFSEELKMLYNNRKNDNFRIVASALKQLERTAISASKEDAKPTQGIIDDSGKDIEEIRIEQERLEQERQRRIQFLIAEGRLPVNLEFEIELTPKGNGYFCFDDSGHIVFPKKTLSDASALFESKTSNYNDLAKAYPEISYYSYYIETDADIDFINGDINHELVNDFFGRLDMSINKGALYINTPDDFKDCFYITDHHWSSIGQRKGYEGIISLIKGEDEQLLDIEIKQIEGVEYYGSRARTLSDFSISDEFSVLVAQLPEHKVFINGEESAYGAKNAYLEGNFSREKGINHYGVASGGDHGLIEYRFNQPNEDNVLVFIESFSDPIKGFIAAHFNNTYFVDLRYYEETFGHEFDFGDFIAENDIDTVLFSGYYFFYANDNFLIKD